ncbi:RNA polymerase sigma factor [Leucothrix sargassi]|nr:RNA polymerase sigma factor [Leucothrix sargassi]
MTDLNELLMRSAAKDQQAFKALYDLTSPKLFGVLVGIMKSESLAEDVLQEAFLKIWQKADTYQASKSGAMTWMRTIATNTARDKLRALKVRHYQDECSDYVENIEGDVATPENHHDISSDLSRLMDAVKGLKPLHAECLILSCYHGYSHSELAKKMNQPLGTVKTWLRLAKEQVAIPVTA